MRGGHHALPVDLDDAVAYTDTAPLRDAPTHEAADLSDTGWGWGVISLVSPPCLPASSCPQRWGELTTGRMKPPGQMLLQMLC